MTVSLPPSAGGHCGKHGRLMQGCALATEIPEALQLLDRLRSRWAPTAAALGKRQGVPGGCYVKVQHMRVFMRLSRALQLYRQGCRLLADTVEQGRCPHVSVACLCA
jgi:hypothetical protein